LSAAFDPIIDICVRLGVNASELESLLRVEFVKRLAAMLPKNPKTGKEPSHEEVALASGLTRAEVQKIRTRGDKKSMHLRLRKRSQRSKSQRVLDLWTSDARFLNNSGGPLALPLDRQLSGPSFEELVAEALPHNRHANVLKDLRRRGLIQVTDDIVRIRRVTQSLPTELNTASLNFIAEQMHVVGRTLLQTVENPEGPGADPVALFAVTEPVAIPEDQLDIVRAALQDQITHFVQHIEKDLTRKVKPGKRKGAKVLVGTSVYTFSNR